MRGMTVTTWHRIVFGDCRDMHEILSDSIHLVVTSPPYYNAPFDYPDLFDDYDAFLRLMEDHAKELYRVLSPGRVAALVTDDILVNGEKYPLVADVTRIMVDAGFRYRDKIIWVKPKGYTRISRRSGVVVQNPYPMYFYPDNLQETILLFQKGKFEYDYVRRLDPQRREASKINVHEYNRHEWNLSVWKITNVLPLKHRLEKGIAAFPLEIPKRLITLFSFVGETVLDPFLGSGTTLKAAKELGRNSWGYEIDLELKEVVIAKANLSGVRCEVIERRDAQNLRSRLQRRVKRRRSVAKRSRRDRAHRE
jgi:DNA modification methylase